MTAQRENFPWSAVLGQDALKRALVLCAIDPAIGGVLVQGPRGVAKTTLARALGELVQGPFVELPLGASEERVTGSLDLDTALRDGRVAFAPGLLARAHQGVLYVDEVNLLPDALVDLLLDAAASGSNTVERDAVSHTHAARFVLIGTMNPEEGELRPQLIDRFGLSATAEGEIRPEQRAEIVLRRLAFDRDPSAFRARFASEQAALRERCQRARALVETIPLEGAALERVSQRCHAAAVEGVRADLAMLRAARAHAAWHGRSEITLEDVDAVAELALAHRRRGPSTGGAGPAGGDRNSGSHGTPSPRDSANSGGSSSAASEPDPSSTPPQNSSASPAAVGGGSQTQPSPGHNQAPQQREANDSHPRARGALLPVPVSASRPRALPSWLAAPSGSAAARARRGKGLRNAREGTRAERSSQLGAIDWFATLSANPKPTRADLRYRARRAAHKQLWLVAIDCSASMLRAGALMRAKGVASALAAHALRARAELVLLAFRAERVTTHAGHARYAHALAELSGGGGTPLRAALLEVFAICRQQRFRLATLNKRLIVLSDGRSREPIADLHSLRGELEPIVIDCERGTVRLGRAAQLARGLRARYVHVDALH